MKQICIAFVFLLIFPYFNMFVWTPSQPDRMSSQASEPAEVTSSSSASASPYYLAAIGADDTAAVLDGYPVKETVIAVIDTGAELSHEDLVDSLWINEAEQNGTDNVDDDNNGYIDDIYGVDFINNVPTPVPEDSSAPLRYEAPEDDSNTSHGTHVSGIIGMNPDNAVGYAGVGYRTKIMILKAGNYKNSFRLPMPQKRIQYAVANGATYHMSLAVIMKTALSPKNWKWLPLPVFLSAAAGNNGKASSNSTMYPAAYPYVIGVMAGNTTDGCWTSSNFVDTSPAPYDILCPGESILSTTRYNSYAEKSGTSMASPMVAGSAAVIMGFLEANKTYESREDLLADTKKYLLMSDSVYTYIADSGLIYITPRLNLKISLQHIIEDLKKEVQISASPSATIEPSENPVPTKTPSPTNSTSPAATETPSGTSAPTTTPVVTPSPTDSAIPSPTVSVSPAVMTTPPENSIPAIPTTVPSPAASAVPSATAPSSPGTTAVPGSTTAPAKKFDTKSLKIKKVTQKKKGKHKLAIKWKKCKAATRYQIRVKNKKNGETRWFYTKKTKITLTRSKKMQVSIRAQKVSGKKIWSGSYKKLPRVG